MRILARLLAFEVESNHIDAIREQKHLFRSSLVGGLGCCSVKRLQSRLSPYLLPDGGWYIYLDSVDRDLRHAVYSTAVTEAPKPNPNDKVSHEPWKDDG